MKPWLLLALMMLTSVSKAQQAAPPVVNLVRVEAAPVQAGGAGGAGGAAGAGAIGGISHVTRPGSPAVSIRAGASFFAAGGLQGIVAPVAPGAAGGPVLVATTGPRTVAPAGVPPALQALADAGDVRARQALAVIAATTPRPATARRR
ncbi:MAG: hypothetical protein KF791_13175 [Verrucomicrobiae bacterium]|nr:hypothetical protein [Verrucomicrobiae bacterium]